MKINVHAGHAPAGCRGCGAVGFLNESFENRHVKNFLIQMLRDSGHDVLDCTYDKAGTAGTVLRNIVAKCNSRKADLDLSIHFNAGAKQTKRNQATTGVECWIYPGSKSYNYARQIAWYISKLGFTHRGVKESRGLYVLRKTKNPAIIIECCFVDDPDDYDLYRSLGLGSKAIAEKIADAINSI